MLEMGCPVTVFPSENKFDIFPLSHFFFAGLNPTIGLPFLSDNGLYLFTTHPTPQLLPLLSPDS